LLYVLGVNPKGTETSDRVRPVNATRTQKLRKLTYREVMRVFVVWLKNGKRVDRTAEATGVTGSTVSRLANNGLPSRGIPSFNELAEEFQQRRLLLLPSILDETWKTYKWNRRKAVSQTLQICEGVRKKVLDAIADPDKVRIETVDDAVKLADALKKIEESIAVLAKSLNLVDGEPPEVKVKTEETAEPEDEFQTMDQKQIEQLADGLH
jgi:hypothetical protein